MADQPAGGERAGTGAAAAPTAGRPFTHRLRVRYSECDAQGVVFNANYLAYFDHSLTELWRAAFGGYERMLERGVDLSVVDAHLRFVAPARFDSELKLEIAITHLGSTSMGSRHRIRELDGTLICEGETVHVWIDRDTATKTPIPDWAGVALAPWRLSAGG